MGLLPKAVLLLPSPRQLVDPCPAVGSSLAPRWPQGFGQWPLVSEVPPSEAAREPKLSLPLQLCQWAFLGLKEFPVFPKLPVGEFLPPQRLTKSRFIRSHMASTELTVRTPDPPAGLPCLLGPRRSFPPPRHVRPCTC